MLRRGVKRGRNEVRHQPRDVDRLPQDVIVVRGLVDRGEVVSCLDESRREIARGLVNYSAVETRRILRTASMEIESKLGYVDEPELIHRDNLVLL